MLHNVKVNINILHISHILNPHCELSVLRYTLWEYFCVLLTVSSCLYHPVDDSLVCLQVWLFFSTSPLAAEREASATRGLTRTTTIVLEPYRAAVGLR